jgi:methionyl-tRNA synthetase
VPRKKGNRLRFRATYRLSELTDKVNNPMKNRMAMAVERVLHMVRKAFRTMIAGAALT